MANQHQSAKNCRERPHLLSFPSSGLSNLVPLAFPTDQVLLQLPLPSLQPFGALAAVCPSRATGGWSYLFRCDCTSTKLRKANASHHLLAALLLPQPQDMVSHLCHMGALLIYTLVHGQATTADQGYCGLCFTLEIFSLFLSLVQVTSYPPVYELLFSNLLIPSVLLSEGQPFNYKKTHCVAS